MGIPFVNFSFIKRVLNQIDVDEKDLNSESTDKVEAELAKSSKEIDEKFSKYGNSSKAQRRKTLEAVKVKKNDLAKPQQVEKVEREQDQREDDYIK